MLHEVARARGDRAWEQQRHVRTVGQCEAEILGSAPGPASRVGAVAPAEATVTLDGRTVPHRQGQYEVSPVDPGLHRLEFRAPGHEPQGMNVTVRPGEAAVVRPVILVASAPLVPPAPTMTGLAVRVRPEGAAIFVNEQPRPERTPVELLPLPAGTHTVRVEMPGFQSMTRVVSVADGAVLTLDGELLPAGVVVTLATLEPETATCTLSRGDADPMAVGRSFAVGPGGEAVLRCTAPEHDDLERRIAVTEGQDPVSLEVRLRPLVAGKAPTKGERGTTRGETPTKRPTTGTTPATASGEAFLSVATRPWTKVYVDGRLVGNTPVLRHKVAPGSRKLVLINEDFNIRESLTVKVAPGETKQIVRNMVQ